VRAFLASHGYRIAQTTLDYEDYLWNSAYARCWMRHDEASIQWLRDSYRTAAREFIRFGRDNSRAVFGRDIATYCCCISALQPAHPAGPVRDPGSRGFEIVTLEEAQQDAPMTTIRMWPDARRHIGRAWYASKEDPWPRMRRDLPRDRLTTIC
jgi:hypothetical protein